MRDDKVLGLVIMFLLIGVAVVLFPEWYKITHKPTSAIATAAKPDGAVTPPAEWMSLYEEYKTLAQSVAERQKKLNEDPRIKSLQEDNDRMVGMIQRLKNSIPTGYNFDEVSLSFTRPVPQPVPVPVVAAPPEVEKKDTSARADKASTKH